MPGLPLGAEVDVARLLVVQDSGINESPAVSELAAFLHRAGHPCHLILTLSEADPAASIARCGPDVVLIPCPVTGHEVAHEAARLVRSACPQALIVFAGTHVTFDSSPAEAPEVDVVVRGEAEYAMLALLEALDQGKDWRGIASLSYAEPSGRVVDNPLGRIIEDLDELPFPDRELYYRYRFLARFPWKKFSTGRGCFHRCAFCWNSTMADMLKADGVDRGRFVRRKSPARAAEEVRHVRDRYPLRSVHFSDDLFTSSAEWLDTFAEVYPQRAGVGFTCSSSIELVTERTASALARAGCRGVAIGVETGNEQLRRQILNKTVTNDDVRRAARLIKSHGMELTTYTMLGAPGETLEDALETVRLTRELDVDHMRVTISLPVPQTAFEADAFANGHLPGGAPRATRLSSPDSPILDSATDGQSIRNLYFLFRVMVRHPELDPLTHRLLRLRTNTPLLPLRALAPLTEKRMNRVGWLDGLRFFRHVGDPRAKTANYVTLV